MWDRSSPAAVSSKYVERQERRDPCSSGIPEEQLLTKQTKNPKPNKNDDHGQERGDLCHSDIPEWLQEFRENLVDDRVPERRHSHASSSHGLSLEPTRSADLGKHSVYTHFPNDRNCEICQRTKITRAPCRRCIGGVVRRAENFGDLFTADQKVLSEGCKSRKQSSICSRDGEIWPPNGSKHIRAKQKLHKKPREACKGSWSPIGSLKSFTLTIPWNLAKLVKISPGIIARHTDRRLMVLQKEQCAE